MTIEINYFHIQLRALHIAEAGRSTERRLRGIPETLMNLAENWAIEGALEGRKNPWEPNFGPINCVNNYTKRDNA